MKIDKNLKNKSGIYRLVSNDVIYVGSSVNLLRRLTDHFRFLKNNKHQNPHLQNHYNKYGVDSFSYYVIEFCDTSCLKEKETNYIEKYKCFEKGFNQSKNSFSPLGYKHSEENKKIMSIKKIGYKQSKEQIEKRRLSLIGKIRTKKHKENYKNSKLGVKNPMFGKKEALEITKSRMKNLFDARKVDYTLLDVINNIEYKSNSLKELANLCPISLATLNRLKFNKTGNSIKKQYKLLW